MLFLYGGLQQYIDLVIHLIYQYVYNCDSFTILNINCNVQILKSRSTHFLLWTVSKCTYYQRIFLLTVIHVKKSVHISIL